MSHFLRGIDPFKSTVDLFATGMTSSALAEPLETPGSPAPEIGPQPRVPTGSPKAGRPGIAPAQSPNVIRGPWAPRTPVPEASPIAGGLALVGLYFFFGILAGPGDTPSAGSTTRTETDAEAWERARRRDRAGDNMRLPEPATLVETQIRLLEDEAERCRRNGDGDKADRLFTEIDLLRQQKNELRHAQTPLPSRIAIANSTSTGGKEGSGPGDTGDQGKDTPSANDDAGAPVVRLPAPGERLSPWERNAGVRAFRTAEKETSRAQAGRVFDAALPTFEEIADARAAVDAILGGADGNTAFTAAPLHSLYDDAIREQRFILAAIAAAEWWYREVVEATSGSTEGIQDARNALGNALDGLKREGRYDIGTAVLEDLLMAGYHALDDLIRALFTNAMQAKAFGPAIEIAKTMVKSKMPGAVGAIEDALRAEARRMVETDEVNAVKIAFLSVWETDDHPVIAAAAQRVYDALLRARYGACMGAQDFAEAITVAQTLTQRQGTPDEGESARMLEQALRADYQAHLAAGRYFPATRRAQQLQTLGVPDAAALLAAAEKKMRQNAD